MYQRLLALPDNQSFFLFGQRGTGKSSLLKSRFGDQALLINLLESKSYLNLSKNPSLLKELVLGRRSNEKLVIIDEIQKIPLLLDEVHSLIENHQVNFALTGSSARKLKKAGVNLLAGRAYTYKLFGLTKQELQGDFNLEEIMQWGSLPKVITAQNEIDKEEYLYSYVTTYLKEEIILEQAVRQIEPFNRFLEVAAQSHGELINYKNIAKDVGVSSVTIKEYFNILEDTLIGFFLPSYSTSVRKKQKTSPKFYFFDLGLVRTLKGNVSIRPVPASFEYGQLFESFIINEIYRLDEYMRSRLRFSQYRVDDTSEIDLIIETPSGKTILIEIKSKNNIHENDVATLNRLQGDFKNAVAFCFSQDPARRKIGETLCLPWQEGLEEIMREW